jgi:SH3 domain-containing YSC84-like protein 1
MHEHVVKRGAVCDELSQCEASRDARLEKISGLATRLEDDLPVGPAVFEVGAGGARPERVGVGPHAVINGGSVMKPARQNILAALIMVAATVVVGGRTPSARSDDDQEKKVKDAAEQSARAAKAFEAIMQVPDKSIPRDLLARAKAVAVFPRVIKVAVTVGGEGGRGVVSRQTDGRWGNPVFLRGGGGSVGPQIGASSTDYFLLLMNDESVEGLMKDKLELGGEAAVAAGPVGRNAGAGTDAMMQAAILSYSRSRGLFAGVNVKGVVVRPEDDLNMAVYNRTARELLGERVGGAATPAGGLNSFPETLGRYTAKPTDAQ